MSDYSAARSLTVPCTTAAAIQRSAPCPISKPAGPLVPAAAGGSGSSPARIGARAGCATGPDTVSPADPAGARTGPDFVASRVRGTAGTQRPAGRSEAPFRVQSTAGLEFPGFEGFTAVRRTAVQVRSVAFRFIAQQDRAAREGAVLLWREPDPGEVDDQRGGVRGLVGGRPVTRTSVRRATARGTTGPPPARSRSKPRSHQSGLMQRRNQVQHVQDPEDHQRRAAGDEPTPAGWRGR